mmetsp:Transcript_15391/g.23061  ORF Transcript_15391/g.23061 Transcript_15391/m.23061 type:complete len:246 (+) Transcript_15391:1317-2054(+)
MGGRILVVTRDRAVERVVFIFSNLFRVTGPDWFDVVHQSPIKHEFEIGFFLIFIILALHIFIANFEAFIFIVMIVIVMFWLDNGAFFLMGLPQVNWKVDKLGESMHQLFQRVFIGVLLDSIFLEEEFNLGTTTKGVTFWILAHSERRVGGTLPDPLVIVVVGFRCDTHFICNQKRRVETNTKLADKVRVSTLLSRFKERFGTRFGNRTQIRDELFFGHTYSSIGEDKSVTLSLNTDPEVWTFTKH